MGTTVKMSGYRSRLRTLGATQSGPHRPAAAATVIHESPLFSDLSDTEKDFLFSHQNITTYHKGQVIFYEGSRPTGLYFVNSGKVKVYKKGLWGKEQIVRLAKTGDLLTYRAVGIVPRYVASAVALDDSEVCFIDLEDFIHVLNTNTRFSFKIIQLLAEEIDKAENKICNLAQKNVRQRLAEILLWLDDAYGENAQDGTMNVHLSREELANMVGTATESVVRLLAELRNKKLLQLEGRTIRILDKARLEKTSNPDGAYSSLNS